ncbi:MAG: Gfo/Idh/MocA family oxidoreductase [Selenomonadaceae bacterium]|nr:Gfo/Idh/MocA family oxidoreductase [Selenomonadaceae bacterium]
MRMGILGSGMIVQDLLTTIDRLNLEYTAILGTERSREHVEGLASKYGLQKTYYDYDELLADENLDTIYVALPNFLHYPFAKKALLADKNVIVEKPVVTNYEEFTDLKSIADARGKILLEAMTVHYLPAYLSIRADLAKLGDIKIVSMNYSQYSSRYDKFKAGEILPAFDPKKAGGALMDINVYNLHFVIGLFGAPKSFSYSANIERGIDTSGVMVLDYGNFKAVCVGAKDCQAPTFSTIQGDKGNIVIQIPTNRISEYSIAFSAGNYSETEREVKNFDDGAHRMIHEFKTFIDIIDGKDFARANKLLETSGIVSKILHEGREQVGIKFAND